MPGTYLASVMRAYTSVACLAYGCATPNITSLDPDNGPERTLVNVNGGTLLSSLYWDADNPQSMAETLMHEFGHNLNQRHGGETHTTNNPTYSSVMSYSWQLRSGRNDADRRQNPIYAPFYYQTNAAIEANGTTPPGWSGITIDYSEGMGRSLIESSLNEPAGLYNGNAINWNLDADITDISASRDINGDGDITDTFNDYSNWANVSFRGPRSNGTN